MNNNKENSTSEKRSFRDNILEYLHDLIYILTAVVLLCLLCFRVVVVTGSSMYNTLIDGDYLLLISSTFYRQPQQGDIIVAGKNFGCGSSREQAPEIIKALGIRCVIAKSFARIFFRNSINNGLLLIENDALQEAVKEGDTITVKVNQDIEHNGEYYEITSLPQNLVDIISAGGLVKAMRKLNGLD